MTQPDSNRQLFSTPLSRLQSASGDLSVPPGSARLDVTYGGDVQLHIHLPVFTLLGQVTDGGELVGETPDGFVARFSDSVVLHTSSRTGDTASEAATTLAMTAVKTVLEPASPQSARWTQKILWLHGPHLFGSDRWSFQAYDFELTTLRNDHKHQVVPVRLSITATDDADTSDYEAVRDATLSLLSMASRTQCRVFLEHTMDTNNFIRVEAVPYPGVRHGTHPLVPPFHLPKFMSTCTGCFLQNEQAYQLATLIAYYCRSHEERIAEAKFIYASVFMEALKFYWALNVGRVQPDLKQNGLVRGFKRPTGKNYSFAELLRMTTQHLGLTHNYTFLDDRNALFHSGQAAGFHQGAASSWPLLKQELVKLHEEIDEVLMALVGYSGEYRPYWSQREERTFP